MGESALALKYEISYLVQSRLPGRKISFRLIMELVRQMREFHPDIVHISGLQSAAFHAILAGMIYHKSKMIMAVRGFSEDDMQMSNLKRSIFKHVIDPFSLRHSDVVYTVCRYGADKKIIKKYARNNFYGVIHNSISKEFNYEDGISFRKEFDIDENMILVVYAGRITLDKGMKILEKVMNDKDIRSQKMVFAIVGDGSYLEDMKKNMKDNKKVFFTGKRNNVRTLLRDTDIFVFPTLHENLSNVLLEACIERNAIVATKVGGNVEVLDDGVDGILVEPYDVKACVDALLELASDENLRMKLGENARQKVIDNFSEEKMLVELDKIYNSI